MLKDRFGNEIRSGVTVTFPTRRSSFLDVVDGIVVDIFYKESRNLYEKEKVPYVYLQKADGKVTFTEMIDRLTVVHPEPRKDI